MATRKLFVPEIWMYLTDLDKYKEDPAIYLSLNELSLI